MDDYVVVKAICAVCGREILTTEDSWIIPETGELCEVCYKELMEEEG